MVELGNWISPEIGWWKALQACAEEAYMNIIAENHLSLTMTALIDVPMIWDLRMSPTRNRRQYCMSRLQTTALRLNSSVCARCFGRDNLAKISPVISDCWNTPKHDWIISRMNDGAQFGSMTRYLQGIGQTVLLPVHSCTLHYLSGQLRWSSRWPLRRMFTHLCRNGQ
jgi:hypothetical protein